MPQPNPKKPEKKPIKLTTNKQPEKKHNPKSTQTRKKHHHGEGTPRNRKTNLKTPKYQSTNGMTLVPKLRLIPDRRRRLEWSAAQRPVTHAVTRAGGWVSGRLGSWWGNGPPSQRSVPAVKAGAGRWALRQRPRPYGAQQSRNLRNPGNRDGAIPSATPTRGFCPLQKGGRIRGGQGWCQPPR